MEIVDQAIALGMPVFPGRLCPKRCLKCDVCKTPICKWKEMATDDPDKIAALWRSHYGPLICVPTGKVSGIDLLDPDLGKDARAVDWWNKYRRHIPHTWIHETGNYGLHVLFQHDPRACNGSKRIPGVDVKSTGGYLVWWPAYGRRVLVDAPIAFWPDWLLSMQRPSISSRAIRLKGATPTSVAGLVSWVARSQIGQRNCSTFWALCRAAEAERQGINGAVDAVARAGLGIGLTNTEINRSVRSARQTINGSKS